MPKIMEGIYFIPGWDEMIPDAHTYVIGNLSSKNLSLIDPGLAGRGNYKVNSIRKLGIEVKDIKRVIMTHTHSDQYRHPLPEIQQRVPWAFRGKRSTNRIRDGDVSANLPDAVWNKERIV